MSNVVEEAGKILNKSLDISSEMAKNGNVDLAQLTIQGTQARLSLMILAQLVKLNEVKK